MYNRRTIARDASGRVFQERKLFSPSGDTKPTTVSELDFYDPVTGTVAVYDPRTNRCSWQPYRADRGDYPQLPMVEQSAGTTIRREQLGERVLLHLHAEGSRETFIANDQTAPAMVKEFWYSPQLAINLVLKRTEWNRDLQTFTLTDLDLHEPDAKLFQPPAVCQRTP